MIDIEKGEISFKLDYPIIIAKDGKDSEVNDVCFKQPGRSSAAHFETLSSSYQSGLMKNLNTFKQFANDEQKQEMEEKGKSVNAQKELEAITYESIMEETEANISIIGMIEFDFEKGYSLFEKMLCSDGQMSICSIGGIPFKKTFLDRINYRDFKKMLIVYITFFAKPAKSDAGKDSSQQSDSHTEVTEV